MDFFFTACPFSLKQCAASLQALLPNCLFLIFVNWNLYEVSGQATIIHLIRIPYFFICSIWF